MKTETHTARVTLVSPVGEPARLAFTREHPAGRRIVARELDDKFASLPMPGGPVTLATYRDLQEFLDCCATALEAQDIAREAHEAATIAARRAQAEAEKTEPAP